MKENQKNLEPNTNKRVETFYYKLNFNEMSNKIFEIISNSKSKLAKEEGLALSFDYQVFLSYLKTIAKRAIETNDNVILFALNNIGALNGVTAEEEKSLKEAYKLWEENSKSKNGGTNNEMYRR